MDNPRTERGVHPAIRAGGLASKPQTDEQDARLRGYMAAGVPENTKAALRSAIRDFCEGWGGFLPATPRDICLYISDRAAVHAHTTIAQRLASISRWHKVQGFTDPTQDAAVKLTMKGIRIKHPRTEKQARAMTLEEVRRIAGVLGEDYLKATAKGDRSSALRASRDKALVLVAFWRAFRSDELSSIRHENVQADKFKGMTIFIARSKNDKAAMGMKFFVPAMKELCPVKAYTDWVEDAGISRGPVFVRLTRAGDIGDAPLRPNSINDVLRSIYKRCGIDPNGISTHSPRRGFAHWAVQNNWNAKGLMEYVGWKDIRNATKYMPAFHSFGDLALSGPSNALREHALPGASSLGGAGPLLPHADSE